MVSPSQITKHQVALQRIATLNDDTRRSSRAGYQQSLDYVVVDAQGGRLPSRGRPVQLPDMGGDATRRS